MLVISLKNTSNEDICVKYVVLLKKNGQGNSKMLKSNYVPKKSY